MPTLTVIIEDKIRQITFIPGISVRRILEETGIWIRSGCRGNGACGLCRVKIESGAVAGLRPNELVLLPREDLTHNIRLACQLFPEDDLSIRVLNQSSKNQWRDLSPDYLTCTPANLPAANNEYSLQETYGLAVDIGTTNICFSIWDLKQGKRLVSRIGQNPQCRYGSDVVTRLMAAEESPDIAADLARLPLEAVRSALRDLNLRDGLSPKNIVHVSFVGNTAMLMLLTETIPHSLLHPGNWTRHIDCHLANAKALINLLEVYPGATVDVIDPLAGFVGSDLLAGIIAVGMLEHPCSLLIDFGTNSEMALWDGTKFWVTSAAGGPAFEGSGIKCGMQAESGAIYQASLRQGSAEMDFAVIGGGQPKGFCGTGLIDLIASLRRSGDLTAVGKFTQPNSIESLAVSACNPALLLSSGDVDLFQRAKAAIGVGVTTLLSRSKMNLRSLNGVYISGAFGLNLNIDNAIAVGLLPDISPRKFKLCGNTALAGSEQLLLVPKKQNELRSLYQNSCTINLSDLPDFDPIFLDNLYLQPQEVII
jgi:uncharacterized 2Fe-2S/4Fe-4S cluster protein (DUF4445 family)